MRRVPYDEANFSERTGGMNAYLDLFLTFARVGGLTFGGGYAMLPILREVVEKRGWVSEGCHGLLRHQPVPARHSSR